MKWSLMFKEKMKAASILVILMLAIILSNLLEKRILKTSNQTVSSIYEDRLTPSTDLFEMLNLNEQRMFVLDELSHANSPEDKIRLNTKLNHIHDDFLKLLVKYEGTVLVKEEEMILKALRANIIQLEKHLIQFKNLSDVNFSEQAKSASKSMMIAINENLSKLNKLQNQIGAQMLKEYKSDTYYSSFLNTFQIMLSFILGIIILKMVSNSRLLNAYDKKINLN